MGVPDDAFVFGTVFRMSEEKRPFLWVELAGRIAARARRPCHFIIVGDGPLMPQVSEAAARIAGGVIHIVGRQTDVGAWYDAMDAIMLTSSVEGMSNAVLEAQYFQRPIVCFNVGGLAEGILDDETGYLLCEGDVDGFVDKAVGLADDPRRAKRMGELGRSFVTAKFSVEALIKNTVAAIRGAIIAAPVDSEHAA